MTKTSVMAAQLRAECETFRMRQGIEDHQNMYHGRRKWQYNDLCVLKKTARKLISVLRHSGINKRVKKELQDN